MSAKPLTLDTKGLTSHRASRHKQWRFDFDLPILRDQVCANLETALLPELAAKIRQCHTSLMTARCTDCRHTEKFWNHCDNTLCPICAPKISHERAEDIKWWTMQIQQPKHVVLTQRNITFLTRAAIQQIKHNWIRLRRSKLARSWKGGCVSLEITNEGSGWHLHLHALVDCRWIDAKQLAIKWGELVGQDFAIVKVQDCREQSYLREVTKYAVKSSDLATWTPEELNSYVTSIKGLRTFWTFGSLFRRRSEFKEMRLELTRQHRCCKSCGSEHVRWFDESEYEWFQTTCDPPTLHQTEIITTSQPHPEFEFAAGLKRTHWAW